MSYDKVFRWLTRSQESFCDFVDITGGLTGDAGTWQKIDIWALAKVAFGGIDGAKAFFLNTMKSWSKNVLLLRILITTASACKIFCRSYGSNEIEGLGDENYVVIGQSFPSLRVDIAKNFGSIKSKADQLQYLADLGFSSNEYDSYLNDEKDYSIIAPIFYFKCDNADATIEIKIQSSQWVDPGYISI